MPASARSLVAAVALTSTLAFAGSATTAPAATAAKPGIAGAVITLTNHVDLIAGSYDIGMSKSGTAYVGWISDTSTDDAATRAVHLCVLPLHATACQGGVSVTPSLGISSAADLKVLATPNGGVVLVWFHDDVASEGGAHASEIAEATVGSDGTLSAPTDVATAPSFGALLDAEVGPGGGIWTIAYAGSLPNQIEVREGITHDPVVVKTPYSVGFAHVAFAHATPIIAITKYGAIGQPAAYSSMPGHTWPAFKNVPRTWTVGEDIGLTATSSGVRLITEVGNADYSPVVAKWNGHGFAARTLTGDHDNSHPTTHDVVADASGRMADVSVEGPQLAVDNFADTTHATIQRFSLHNATVAGGNPQIGTTPRGEAWVAWSVEATPAGTGNKLLLVPFRLPGGHQLVSKHGRHGRITVTGPTSCLPADTISVGVSGHPKHGWHVSARHLSLSGKTVHSTLEGASLKAGKKYALKGTVTFASGGSHETVKATVKFRACPKP